jgi:hypothetical protein
MIQITLPALTQHYQYGITENEKLLIDSKVFSCKDVSLYGYQRQKSLLISSLSKIRSGRLEIVLLLQNWRSDHKNTVVAINVL